MVGIRRKQPWRSSPGTIAATAVAAAGAAGALLAGAMMVLLGGATPVSAEVKNSLTITSPFERHDHKGSRIIPFWETGGSTNIMQSFVRITPDKPHNTGTLWSRTSIGSPDFSLEWKFRISGSEAKNIGDSFALIISPMKYTTASSGRFFGIRETFTGMAIIVNTNRALLAKNLKPGEPNGRHRDVSLVANNGTRDFGDLVAGLEGCNANVRFDERRDDFNVMQSTRIRLKVSANTATMEIDARNSGRWRRCATVAHLDMPPDWATKCNIGMIAQTTETTNNHDLLSFRTYSDPQDAWEVDNYDEDLDELDGLVHHMEHELFDVHDSLQQTIAALREEEEKAEKRLEDLEQTLSKNVMEALESRVAKLEVQMQTSVHKTLNKHVDKVYDQLESDVSGKLSEHVGKMSSSWQWPFYGLLGVVLGMVGMSLAKYKQLKKQHLL